MAILNTGKGGTDRANGSAASSADENETDYAFYDKDYFDTSSNSSGSTSETDLNTITALASDFNQITASTNTTFKVWGSIGFKSDNSGTTPTFRLYIGGVLKQTITPDTTVGNISSRGLPQILYGEDGIDMSTNKIVKVTVQWNNSTASPSASCEGLIVTVKNNNN